MIINISKIYDLVKDYPDFIHLDLIDESYNPDNISCDVEKIAEAKNVWPTKKFNYILCLTTQFIGLKKPNI